MNVSSSSGTNFNKMSNVSRGPAFDFSSLPVDALTNIFSFLTSKEALSICGSCKKLKHMTNLIPNVEIKETADDCPIKKKEFVESISKFLANHAGLVKKIQLSFCPGEYTSDVLCWLSFIVKNGVEEIDLMFKNSGEFLVIIPASLLTVGTLKVLKLRQCVVDDLPSITGLKSLKSLFLGDMDISNDVMRLLCCHCESLRNLTLRKCSGFEEIEIVNPRSKLEILILVGHYWSHLRLNILSLKALEIHTRQMNLSFIGCPHIGELVLCRGELLKITQEESENMKANIINKLQNVRSLHLAGWAFECFSAYRSIENYKLTNLKVLGLDFFDVCLYKQAELNYLIKHAESLKTLHISVKPKYDGGGDYSIYIDRNFERVFANYLDNISEVKPTVGFRNNSAFSSTPLQNIEIKDFTGTLYEVSYIKFVLAHFLHLRVIKVTPIKGTDEEQIRAYAKLFSRFPRVSTDVYMLVGSEEVWKTEEA